MTKAAVKDIEGAYDRYLAGIKAVRERGANIEKTADEGGAKLNSRYSYDSLTAKPDMDITVVDDTKTYLSNSTTRKAIVDSAVANAAAIGFTNEQGNAVVHVDDIDTDIIVSKNGLRHGLDRRLETMAPITIKAGEILKNAIRLNELTPRSIDISNAYVLIGIAKNGADKPYLVEFLVNRATNELTSVDVLYSLNTKTEPAGSLSPGVPALADHLTGSKKV